MSFVVALTVMNLTIFLLLCYMIYFIGRHLQKVRQFMTECESDLEYIERKRVEIDTYLYMLKKKVTKDM